jgi:uncharacterized protein YjbI with pentapeptide repeats
MGEKRIGPIWEAATAHLQRASQRLAPRRRTAFWAAGIIIIIIIAALLLISFLSGQIQVFWEWYSRPGVSTTVASATRSLTTTDATTITNSQTTNAKSNADVVNPLGAAIGAAVLAWIALRQMGIARRQADIARKQAETADQRHTAQTDADRQRRITESFSRAIDQLANDKLETRLGGIYMLERIARDSLDDHWTVMETLCAFVRERAKWKEPTLPKPTMASGQSSPPNAPSVLPEEPATDIAGALTVIGRRREGGRDLEQKNGWQLDLNRTRLSGAHLSKAHLERAKLRETHLEGANLSEAHLEDAILDEAHLQGAILMGAHLERAFLAKADLQGAILGGAHLEDAFLGEMHLEGAYLSEAHLEDAFLGKAHLEDAFLGKAHLERATLRGAHLQGAHLAEALGLSQYQIDVAHGDASTQLPPGLTRPTHWPTDSRKAAV